MNGLVRLNISSRIGTGHFQRMMNLAQAMPDLNFTFLIKTDNPESKLFHGHKVFFTGDNDFSDLAYHSKNTDFVIYDLLHYSKDYIKQVKKITEKLTITFHEYNDYSTASDLAINYNFFNGFEKKESPTFLAGPRYAIFNDTLLHTRSSVGKSVFVSFGGADPSGFTIKFINEIANYLTQIPFNIHIGPFFRQRDHLASLRMAENVILHDQPHNLYDLMSQARLSVTAGGNMLYELMFLQKWSFTLAHNVHQKEFSVNAGNYGACKYMGDKDTIDWGFFRNVLEDAYMTPARTPAYEIDGKGKYIIVNKINELLS